MPSALAPLLAKLNVPVGKVDEVTPAVIHAACERNVDEWAPLRPLRFFQELHSRLMRKSVSLTGIAGNAGANDILPCCLSSAVAGQHVIDVQIVPFEQFPAVLAGVLIALKDVEAREFHLFLG